MKGARASPSPFPLWRLSIQWITRRTALRFEMLTYSGCGAPHAPSRHEELHGFCSGRMRARDADGIAHELIARVIMALPKA